MRVLVAKQALKVADDSWGGGTLSSFLDTRSCILDTLPCFLDTLSCFLDTLSCFIDKLITAGVESNDIGF